MNDTLPTLTESALRGIACRCPRCGKGKLYAGFLNLRPSCESCGRVRRASPPVASATPPRPRECRKAYLSKRLNSTQPNVGAPPPSGVNRTSARR